MMQEIKKMVSSIQTISGLVLFACLPIHFNGVTRWSMILFILFSIVDYFLQGRYKNNSFFTLKSLPFWSIIGLYLLLLLYIPYETANQYIPLFVENRAAFLAFGVLGVLGTYVPPRKYIAYTSIVVSLSIVLYTLYLGWQYPPEDPANWREHINYIRHVNIQSHMVVNMYLNIGIIACFWLIKECKKYRFCLIVPMLILYTAIALSDGRVGFISSHVIVLMGLCYLCWEKHKKILVGLIIGCCLAGGIAFYCNAKIATLLTAQEDIRHNIWSTSLALYQENPYWGVGASTNAVNLMERFSTDPVIQKNRYLMKSFHLPHISGAHPHNQLLQGGLEFGILGLLLTLTALLGPLLYCLKNKSSLLVIAGLIAMLIQLQSEVISGSIGYLAFCFYLLLAMNYAQQSSKKVVGSV